MNEKENDDRADAPRAARLTAQAETVFGSTETARRWLSKPKKTVKRAIPERSHAVLAWRAVG